MPGPPRSIEAKTRTTGDTKTYLGRRRERRERLRHRQLAAARAVDQVRDVGRSQIRRRAANNSFAEADASLPPLVAFLETAAPFLLKAYGRPAGELLQLLGGVAAASKGGAAANLASANISDLVDRAARGQLTVPETFTTFTAPA